MKTPQTNYRPPQPIRTLRPIAFALAVVMLAVVGAHIWGVAMTYINPCGAC